MVSAATAFSCWCCVLLLLILPNALGMDWLCEDHEDGEFFVCYGDGDCSGFIGCLFSGLFNWGFRYLPALLRGPCPVIGNPLNCGSNGKCIGSILPPRVGGLFIKRECECSPGWGYFDFRNYCEDQCDTNWYGRGCNLCVVGSNACGDHGTCIEENGYPYCKCDEGWVRGDSLSKQCSVECDPGWFGTIGAYSCNSCVVDSDACGEHGTCLTDLFLCEECNECECDFGWKTEDDHPVTGNPCSVPDL